MDLKDPQKSTHISPVDSPVVVDFPLGKSMKSIHLCHKKLGNHPSLSGPQKNDPGLFIAQGRLALLRLTAEKDPWKMEKSAGVGGRAVCPFDHQKNAALKWDFLR